MKLTLYFKLTDALVKIECANEDALNMVFDDMAEVGAEIIPEAEFDNKNVLTLLIKGESVMHIAPLKIQKMTLEDFEQLVDEHSLLPGNNLYNSNALCGEAGELANVCKKIEIFSINPEWIADKKLEVQYFKNQEVDELGDLLFYVVRKIHDTGASMSTIMDLQRSKLKEQTKKYGRTFKK